MYDVEVLVVTKSKKNILGDVFENIDFPSYL